MKTDHIDEIHELLIHISSVLRRKTHREFFRAALKQVGEDITRQHLIVLRALFESGPVHVSEIGEELAISKSQMTHLTDKLMDLGMIERQPDRNDRRKINIVLTSKGEETLIKVQKLISENISAKFADVPDEDMETLITSFKNIHRVLEKIHRQ